MLGGHLASVVCEKGRVHLFGAVRCGVPWRASGTGGAPCATSALHAPASELGLPPCTVRRLGACHLNLPHHEPARHNEDVRDMGGVGDVEGVHDVVVGVDVKGLLELGEASGGAEEGLNLDAELLLLIPSVDTRRRRPGGTLRPSEVYPPLA